MTSAICLHDSIFNGLKIKHVQRMLCQQTKCINLLLSHRSCSAVCNLQCRGPGPESVPSLPGLANVGWKDCPGLAVPSSPFPLLTALCLLLDSVTGIHKGLGHKVPVSGLFHAENDDVSLPPCGVDGSCSASTACIVVFVTLFSSAVSLSRST